MRSGYKTTMKQKFMGSTVVHTNVEKLCAGRWEYMKDTAIMAAYHLDPRNHFPEQAYLPSGAVAEIQEYLMSLMTNEADKKQIKKEYAHFRSYTDPFHCTRLVWTTDEVENPIFWWKSHGHKTPLLKKVALVLLSLPATSSAVERSFSSLDFVHSKLRNRLSNLKREMLLCMCYNIRSLHKDLIPVIGREVFRYTSKGSLVVSLPG